MYWRLWKEIWNVWTRPVGIHHVFFLPNNYKGLSQKYILRAQHFSNETEFHKRNYVKAQLIYDIIFLSIVCRDVQKKKNFVLNRTKNEKQKTIENPIYFFSYFFVPFYKCTYENSKTYTIQMLCLLKTSHKQLFGGIDNIIMLKIR